MDLRRHFAAPPAYSSRRDFLKRSGSGFGLLALLGLLEQEGLLAAPAEPGGKTLPARPLAARPGHRPSRVKSVIWLFMNGGPSQVDTWDYRPALEKHDGQELPGFDKNTGF